MTQMWNLMSRALIWGARSCHFFFRNCLKSSAWADQTAMYKAPPVLTCLQLQTYHTRGLLHRQDWLMYKAAARKDGCKVWNLIAGGQQTTLWLNYWCSALSSLSWGDTPTGCICSSTGLGILTGLINKHSECRKCNWFLFHRKAENVSHSTWSINQNT